MAAGTGHVDPGSQESPTACGPLLGVLLLCTWNNCGVLSPVVVTISCAHLLLVQPPVNKDPTWQSS